MNAIGGYFELELPYGEEYHKNAIRLNTCRNAFEYILIAKSYKRYIYHITPMMRCLNQFRNSILIMSFTILTTLFALSLILTS